VSKLQILECLLMSILEMVTIIYLNTLVSGSEYCTEYVIIKTHY